MFLHVFETAPVAVHATAQGPCGEPASATVGHATVAPEPQPELAVAHVKASAPVPAPRRSMSWQASVPKVVGATLGLGVGDDGLAVGAVG
jgi:hypothetical protein